MTVLAEKEERLASRSDAERRRFESMLSETERRAYSMAFQLTRNSTEAEDLVQDTVV